jgi:hypothetical protein
MTNQLTKRFDELAGQAKTLVDTAQRGETHFDDLSDRIVEGNAVLNWRTKAGSLVKLTCGENSEQMRLFHEASQRSAYTSNIDMLERMQAVFEAAREDFKGGYLVSIRMLVQAEVFTSELEQASELLAKGYKVPAAVIAGTVLETGVRELCERNQIAHGKLDRMNAELAKAGVYTVLVQKRVTALADIRNNAAHGHPDQFTDQDVRAMIPEIERFLAEHIS